MNKRQLEKLHTEFDTALSALADPYRRQLFLALLEHNPQDDDDTDPLDLVPEKDEPEILKTELVHNHLPKLEEMGFITWNRTTNKISKGPNWDEIAPLLKLIDKHKDELPDGWL
jgi:hypothetical protein